jgi:hypothetical protein
MQKTIFFSVIAAICLLTIPMPSKSTADEGDLCCYDDKGKMIARCSQLAPYYNTLNGECYAVHENCVKDSGGHSFCFRCSTKC